MTGEWAHSAMDGKSGHYGDDVWFYDLYANRWICLYEGTHIPSFAQRLKDGDLRVDDQGILRDRRGRPGDSRLHHDRSCRLPPRLRQGGQEVCLERHHGGLAGAVRASKSPMRRCSSQGRKKRRPPPASGCMTSPPGKTEWFDKKDKPQDGG